ncbi:uncharacterized protein LOC116347457 isoform X2 [Contarinia nasturtii]|nr:uncharacterized protein LOC116347457 isoform X2 [Contarinia nasturtii]XP_031633900.1 uncharacterized protein LOC116347457 isoform X2 [Contarinia nasturtii]XP_031633901.1 uncharacterized protein LOC116347457 isoform X2 [Contarinia nasturtii]XP_031633902.1 uncharacterized protein LOC116347457 isoform X2 [Contarinia nasturtii]
MDFVSNKTKLEDPSANLSIATSDLPSIFKLSVECFHKIFDLLSLSDLIAVGQTCKHLQRIAGELFRINYTAKVARESNGIYISALQSNIFSKFIEKISISGDRLRAYQFVGANCSKLIKYFRVHGNLPRGGFEYVKEILKNIECLELNECVMNDELYENCLKYCVSLKSLYVTRSVRIRDKSIIIGTDNEWLLRSYPTLEYVELADCYRLENNQLQTFFEKNPNIHTFSTDSRTLWVNRHIFFESNIKLDVLAIDAEQNSIVGENNQLISMVDCIYTLLNELYERKCFKSLNLYMTILTNQENVNKLLSLKAIDILHGDIRQIDHPLVDLKVAGFFTAEGAVNTQNLPNVQQLYTINITVDRIWLVIRSWPKLKEIRIRHLFEGIQYRKLDLVALNRERRKLAGAQKITIYLTEDDYLAIKWTTRFTDLDLIQVKRLESTDYDTLCARFRYFVLF